MRNLDWHARHAKYVETAPPEILNAIHQHLLDVAVARICDQSDRMQEVVNDYGLEHIELEVALRAGKSDGGRCTMNLYAHHGHSIARRGVYLAGHDGRSQLVFWNRELAQ